MTDFRTKRVRGPGTPRLRVLPGSRRLGGATGSDTVIVKSKIASCRPAAADRSGQQVARTTKKLPLSKSLFSIVLFVLLALAPPLPAQTITAANFADAAQYSRTHGGLALRVEQGGRLVDEAYFPGFSASVAHRIYSGTKSFVAVGYLIAAQEGLLTFDEKASDTLTEWRNDRRRTITINELLNQTSGLNPDGGEIYDSRDQMAAALDTSLIDPPGTRFHYGPVNYQSLGELLTRKLRAKNESVEDFLKRKVFDPLDIDIDHWTRDNAGHVLLHSGISLTPEQWAKFGAFINRGLEGKPDQLVSDPSLARLFVGSHANPAYALGFWLNRPPPVPQLQSIKKLQLAIDGDQLYPGGPRDLVACIGSEKQRLYMIPSLDLVIVRFGQETSFSDGDFLSRLLTGKAHPDAHSH